MRTNLTPCRASEVKSAGRSSGGEFGMTEEALHPPRVRLPSDEQSGAVPQGVKAEHPKAGRRAGALGLVEVENGRRRLASFGRGRCRIELLSVVDADQLDSWGRVTPPRRGRLARPRRALQMPAKQPDRGSSRVLRRWDDRRMIGIESLRPRRAA
jgi:hypothetical protein